MVTIPNLPFAIPSTLVGILILVVALVILWVIVSLPVYAAGKLVTDGKATLGDAMAATLIGALAYFLVFYLGAIALGLLIGSSGVFLAFILALVVWLAAYKASFDTSWLGTIGIVLVAWVVFFILDIFLVAAFGVTFPKFYPF